MGWADVMNMPLRAFWMLNTQINRLRAEESLEQVDLALIGGMGATGEMIKEFRAAMMTRLGSPIVFIPSKIADGKEHAEGIAKLRGILGG